MEDNQWTGPSLRLRATQLAAANKNPAVTMGEPAACWPGLSADLFWEEPGVCDMIPILVATRVGLATVAAMSSWNRVLERPK